MNKTGTADLPLHGGRVPRWLADRMTRLAGAITEAIVEDAGPSSFLARLSDPFWFQAFGAALGMDWHSSGITTSVVGALKRALEDRGAGLGLYVCGGRGRYSRRTPEELRRIGDATGLDGEGLVRASRLTAKVDNTCLQDGYQIYLHCFVLSSEGQWTVIQQGMQPSVGTARRYHWCSLGLDSFVSDPHTAVHGENAGRITNLSDARAEEARWSILDFMHRPQHVQERELARLSALQSAHLSMPSNHEVRQQDVDPKRLGAVLALAYERELREFADALLLQGLGPRTMQSLALVSEVVYGRPSRFEDPARFSFAHGGKDGHPGPVMTRSYDETITVLESALRRARLGEPERLAGLKKLHDVARRIEEQHAPHASVERVIEKEHREAPTHGGRTVMRDYGAQRRGEPHQHSRLQDDDRPDSMKETRQDRAPGQSRHEEQLELFDASGQPAPEPTGSTGPTRPTTPTEPAGPEA